MANDASREDPLTEVVQTLLAAGFDVSGIDRHVSYSEIRCERVSRLGPTILYVMGLTLAEEFTAEQREALVRSGRAEGRLPVFIGPESADAQLGLSDFLDFFGGSVPSWQTLNERYRAGREVMLHLPMEPEASSRVAPGKEEICVGMTSFEIEHILESSLASVPQAVGVNNHMGSRATADPRLMAAVMRSLAEHHLYFVDSRTTAASVALEAARQQGLPAFYRSVFLDDTRSVPYTLGQLRRFRRVLQAQGAALAIGHPYPTTIAALAKFLPELERHDVELAPASRLLQLPEIARLNPPPPRKSVQ
jgi:polysaccharide deacetylase 2 family uncharacterized protein YibQ